MNNFPSLARKFLPSEFLWLGFDRNWNEGKIQFFIHGPNGFHEGFFESKGNKIIWTKNTPQSLVNHFDRILKLQSFQ